MKSGLSSKYISLLLISSLVFLAGAGLFAPRVKADEATFGLLRLNRMKVGQTSGGTVCLQPSASDTAVTSVEVTFPDGNGSTTGFDLSATESEFDANVTDLPSFGGTPATAFPSIDGVTPTVSSQTITYSIPGSPSLNSTLVYCFNFAGGLTARANPASDLTGTIVINATPGETAVYAVATLSEDQITVSATVPQIFNFSLSGTSIPLGNLSTSTVSEESVIAQIGTNAKNGWISWIHNESTGLYSTTQSSEIPAPGTYPNLYDLTSTTGYVLDVDAGTGATIDAAYDGGANQGGVLSSSFKQIAYSVNPATADGFTLNVRVRIDPAQPAASDYADILTIAASGEF